jgi:hypothetical protein
MNQDEKTHAKTLPSPSNPRLTPIPPGAYHDTPRAHTPLVVNAPPFAPNWSRPVVAMRPTPPDHPLSLSCVLEKKKESNKKQKVQTEKRKKEKKEKPN